MMCTLTLHNVKCQYISIKNNKNFKISSVWGINCFYLRKKKRLEKRKQKEKREESNKKERQQ